MGAYRAAIVTESGQNLIAQALANETPLIFTSAKTSSYSYPVGTNVPTLTGLQDVVQSVMPFDSKVLGGNVAQVSVRFDNDGVDQTYRIETIGLYAKIEGGTETLFSVTQATTPDEMPVQSDISPSAYIYNIQHTVQNASQITLTVNPAGTATVQDIMDIETPEFDDSGTVSGISSFPDFLNLVKSKMNFFQFFRNFKAGMQFVLHAGQIVNNCVTDNARLPLSAAQGKVLKDLYTQLYSDLNITNNNLSNRLGNTFVDSSTCSNLNDLDTGIYNVNNYDGKITNVPFPGGSFMCVVAKQGDLYKYLLASVEGSLATKSLINGSWSSWAYYALKSDLNKNGAQIGSLLKVYHGESSDKQNKVTLTTSATHMCGFLIIDQNNQTDVYVIGVNSGVTTLCKTSAENTPVISKNSSGCTLEIPLKTWSSFVFLSFYSCNISTTLM